MVNVRLSLATFSPSSFGTNLLVGLNERLGALDRCQGGFFTNTTEPADTKFEIPAGESPGRDGGAEEVAQE